MQLAHSVLFKSDLDLTMLHYKTPYQLTMPDCIHVIQTLPVAFAQHCVFK